ncbi:hypothetical protein K1T71_013996 [Dendrolimus kikuchii]|uniref:Uncharacterized protein n=1 Tax=Dendrolimus kikuchii TaxID=765133 RepID=A0ACC1CGB1_9NEOP|nr:hypothetical protein K1T71_013996 [Dendrolimus kikuchii]
MVKRWYRSRRNLLLLICVTVFSLLYYLSLSETRPSLDITRRHRLQCHQPGPIVNLNHSRIYLKKHKILSKSVPPYIENKLQEALKEDKGTGCEIPHLDPFAREVTQFDKPIEKVECQSVDWVKCHLSQCKVVQEILDETENIVCTYRDILYESDSKYVIGPPVDVEGANTYVLNKSDHVKVKCVGKNYKTVLPMKWTGHSIGFRTSVERKRPPPGREDTLDILIFGFDSTSKNGFIRRMPKSYDYLVNELGGIVLEGYNIVGDGTPAALFPILTGKTELELPDVRKRMKNNRTLDDMPFLFYRLKDDGYRTAYFEDMPWIGTFQYRFNGFKRMPADHYLRAFYLEESNSGKKWWKGAKARYCVGDTPQYKLMMNITEQFFELDGKKFGFTFIADITHDDFNMIATADDETLNFLRSFKAKGRLDNTLVFVMGDHGPRYANVRSTLQGKLEERLPLMCVLVPPSLARSRRSLVPNLRANSRALTTPHDIHATLLDAMGLPDSINYKVPGADLQRGMSLFEPIPRNRSCSEAGIEPHWCACLRWLNVSSSDPMHGRVADAMVNFVNKLTEPVRSKCIPRTLTSVVWVMRQVPNRRMLTFVAAKDADGYVGKFIDKEIKHNENYQIKFVVGPGEGVYEASLTYLVKENKFSIDTRDISRTNAYNNEPSCISVTHPHLNMFCYCNNL